MPEKPLYWTIRSLLHSGEIIPFLGAGTSFGSRDPSKDSWSELIDPKKGTWKPRYLPTGSELAEVLADESELPGDTLELTAVSQYYRLLRRQLPVKNRLHEIFTCIEDPGAIHRYLAQASKDAPQFIVTTNYDDLIERAFDEINQPYDTVVHVTDSTATGEILWRTHKGPSQELLSKDLLIDLSKQSVIYKIHGAIDREMRARGQYVITEDDYVEFLVRMTRNSAIPNVFAELFQTRPLLFLGYSASAWNLCSVLYRIETELWWPGDITSYAIETRSKPLEKELWKRRDVIIY